MCWVGLLDKKGIDCAGEGEEGAEVVGKWHDDRCCGKKGDAGEWQKGILGICVERR